MAFWGGEACGGRLGVQGGGLRDGLRALQQQGVPQRHLARPAVLAPLVGLLRGGAAQPDAARLAATLLSGIAEAGPDARAAIRCAWCDRQCDQCVVQICRAYCLKRTVGEFGSLRTTVASGGCASAIFHVSANMSKHAHVRIAS